MGPRLDRLAAKDPGLVEFVRRRGASGLRDDARRLRERDPVLSWEDGGLWLPSPHDEWLDSTTAGTVVLAGANSGGKTAHGSRLAVRAMLGRDHRFRCPLEVLLGTTNFPLSRVKQQKEFAKWLPPGAIKDGRYDSLRGWVGGAVELNCGCVARFASYMTAGGETHVSAFESRDVDLAILDEPPPEAIYLAAAARLRSRNSRMILTMTILGGKRTWQYAQLVKPWHEDGDRSLVDGRQLRYRDNPTLTAEDEVAYRARLPLQVQRIRVSGEFLDLSAMGAVCARAMEVMAERHHAVTAPIPDGDPGSQTRRVREALLALPMRDPTAPFAVVAYVDWAKSQRGGGSRFAVSVVAVAPGVSWLLEGIAGQYGPDERVEVVIRAALRWRPDVLLFEAVAAQEEFMLRYAERVGARVRSGALPPDFAPRHRPVHPTPGRGKRARIESNLVLEMEQGHFWCRLDDPLLDEASSWTGDEREGCDLLDATAGAIEHGRPFIAVGGVRGVVGSGAGPAGEERAHPVLAVIGTDSRGRVLSRRGRD